MSGDGMTALERRLLKGADDEGRAARRHATGGPESDTEIIRGPHRIDKFFFDLVMEYHSRLVEVMSKFRELYRMIRLVDSGELLSNFTSNEMSIPFLRVGLERLKQKIVQGLFSGPRYVEFMPEFGTPQEFADAMTNFVLDGNVRSNFQGIFEDEVLHDELSLGTSITETIWNQRVEELRFEDAFDFQLADGTEGMVETTDHGNYLVYAHPAIRRIDPMLFLPARVWGAEKLDDLNMFGIERAYSWHNLYRERIRVEEVLTGRGPRLLRLGRFRNLPPQTWASRVPAQGGMRDEYQLPTEMLADDPDHACMDGFEAVELHMDMNIEGLLFHERMGSGEGDGPGQQFEFNSEIAPWLRKWRFQEQDLGPDTGTFVLTVLPKANSLIEIRRNPFGADRQFDLGTHFKRAGALFGMGVYEMFWPMQGTMNQVVDNIRIAIQKITDPMAVVNTAVLDLTKRGEQDAITYRSGGKVIELDTPIGMSGPLFQYVHPPLEIIKQGILYIENLRSSLEYLMGMPDVNQALTADRLQATTSTLIQQNADALLVAMIVRNEKFLLRPIHDKFWKLARQRLKIPVNAQVWDDDESDWVGKVIDPELLGGQFRVKTMTQTMLGDWATRMQGLVNMLSAIQAWTVDEETGVQLIKSRGTTEEVIRSLQPPFPLRKIVKTREEAAFEAQRRAQAAGGNAEEGNGGGGGGPRAIPVLENRGDLSRNRDGGAVVLA